METDPLVEVLGRHFHVYDSDCGTDSGCSCGEIVDYYESDIMPEEHLADVIRQEFDVQPRGGGR